MSLWDDIYGAAVGVVPSNLDTVSQSIFGFTPADLGQATLDTLSDTQVPGVVGAIGSGIAQGFYLPGAYTAQELTSAYDWSKNTISNAAQSAQSFGSSIADAIAGIGPNLMDLLPTIGGGLLGGAVGNAGGVVATAENAVRTFSLVTLILVGGGVWLVYHVVTKHPKVIHHASRAAGEFVKGVAA